MSVSSTISPPHPNRKWGLNPFAPFYSQLDALEATRVLAFPAALLTLMYASSLWLLLSHQHTILTYGVDSGYYSIRLILASGAFLLLIALCLASWRGYASRLISVTLLAWLVFEITIKLAEGHLTFLLFFYYMAFSYGVKGVRGTFWLAREGAPA